MALHNQAVKHNMAMFSELSLAIRWKERLSRGISRNNSTNVRLLTPAVMVHNLAEKVNKCPLKLGSYKYCLRTIGSAKTVCYME